MKIKKILLSAAAVAGLSMGALTAHAVPITGSISFDGAFDCDCFSPGDTSIVSQLISLFQESPADASGGFGDYAGSVGDNSVGTETIVLNVLPPGLQPVYTTADGYEFFADKAFNIVRTAMTCANGVCQDSLSFFLSGTVKRAGFSDTSFIAIWTGQGSCLGGAGRCATQPTASWSASLSSPAAEPGSLALLGLGLVGFGLARRRKA